MSGRNHFQEGDGFCIKCADFEMQEFSAESYHTSSNWPAIDGFYFQQMLEVLCGNFGSQGCIIIKEIAGSSGVDQG